VASAHFDKLNDHRFGTGLWLILATLNGLRKLSRVASAHFGKLNGFRPLSGVASTSLGHRFGSFWLRSMTNAQPTGFGSFRLRSMDYVH
jgi:hypothetical protein